MWNINRGFNFAHGVEDRHTEGKLGHYLEVEGRASPSV